MRNMAMGCQLTLLRCSAHRDARASRTYSKTNMARCSLWCLQDDIVEQYLEWQLTLRQRQMADLYSREQYFRSVKIYKDVTVFDIEACCFRSQLKNEKPHLLFLSSTTVTSGAKSRNQQPSTFRTTLKYTITKAYIVYLSKTWIRHQMLPFSMDSVPSFQQMKVQICITQNAIFCDLSCSGNSASVLDYKYNLLRQIFWQ